MERRSEGAVFKRKDRPNLYMRFFDPVRQRTVTRATPFVPGEEAQAQEWLDRTQAALGRGLTVAAWAEEWCGRRRAAGIEMPARGSLATYALPQLGALHLFAVRPQDVASVIVMMRRDRCAPDDTRALYAMLRSMFNSAMVEGRCRATPCTLTDAQLDELLTSAVVVALRR